MAPLSVDQRSGGRQSATPDSSQSCCAAARTGGLAATPPTTTRQRLGYRARALRHLPTRTSRQAATNDAATSGSGCSGFAARKRDTDDFSPEKEKSSSRSLAGRGNGTSGG